MIQVITLPVDNLTKDDLRDIVPFRGSVNYSPLRIGDETFAPGSLRLLSFAGKLELPPHVRGANRDTSGGCYNGVYRFEKVTAADETGVEFNNLPGLTTDSPIEIE